MITVNIGGLGPITWGELTNAGLWLDQMIPNPPLPAQQRWWITNRAIVFEDEKDAAMFMLKWAR